MRAVEILDELAEGVARDLVCTADKTQSHDRCTVFRFSCHGIPPRRCSKPSDLEHARKPRLGIRNSQFLIPNSQAEHARTGPAHDRS